MIEKNLAQVSIQEIEKEFEPVIGYKSIKNEMIKICDIMRNSEFYARLGVSVPNGLLLDGDPGLGKTLMANCFIKASGRKLGRDFGCKNKKHVLDGKEDEIIRLFGRGMPKTKIAKIMGVSSRTIYNFLISNKYKSFLALVIPT